LDEAAAFAFRAKEAGPPCSECRYRTLLDMCSNPAYLVQEFSPATGEYSEKSRTDVKEARDDTGLCGPEALLFEPRTTFQRTVIAAVTSKPGLWTMFILGAAVLDGLLR
jgi:hypothetical protein